MVPLWSRNASVFSLDHTHSPCHTPTCLIIKFIQDEHTHKRLKVCGKKLLSRNNLQKWYDYFFAHFLLSSFFAAVPFSLCSNAFICKRLVKIIARVYVMDSWKGAPSFIVHLLYPCNTALNPEFKVHSNRWINYNYFRYETFKRTGGGEFNNSFVHLCLEMAHSLSPCSELWAIIFDVRTNANVQHLSITQQLCLVRAV